ncbi:acetyl-CoA carboxylase biotin carboxyl carrier protein [Lactobacillus sp. DCY120]|uniref:Biotin carboxyl carrier protein of acetyl-CoA carboxylase n=1 Tax=Bombilactobacillus apium TaxID=2675299 RepID=A0A850RD51_9LACO|nr:acetyl-CoA carboxylase biotin carboxyl carrier protein [Bombilactobacillus apium]NVY96688.1 acetyl-CoA carboxylase biotin carboxyl carrier protein [Bombilactobacillus apium]
MNFEQIQTLIQQVNASDLREFKLDFEGNSLYLSKNQTALAPAPTPAVETTPAPAANVPAVETKTPAPAPVAVGKPQAAAGTAIKAPLVGIVYLQPSPDQPAYKKVGDHVAKGDVVCVIEAMKMMTEVKSEISGTVQEILVSNEEVVEYDQPLLTVVSGEED